jgi:hypothetical protein
VVNPVVRPRNQPFQATDQTAGGRGVQGEPKISLARFDDDDFSGKDSSPDAGKIPQKFGDSRFHFKKICLIIRLMSNDLRAIAFFGKRERLLHVHGMAAAKSDICVHLIRSFPVDFASLHPSVCLRQSFSRWSIVSPFGLPCGSLPRPCLSEP